MTTDLLDETRIALRDASRHPLLRQGRRPGRPIHRATLERWHRRGVRGVRLETIVIGGVRFTSVEALRRFLHRASEAADAGPPPAKVGLRHDVAEQQLEAAGI